MGADVDTRIIYGAILMIVMPTVVLAEEMDGFKLGMSIDEIRRKASENNYSFSNPVKGNSGNWTSFVLSNGGPVISFCGNTLTAMNKTYTSNTHEFANLLDRWTKSLGQPEPYTSQMYAQGVQNSTIGFKWEGVDNVRRSIAMNQYGSNPIQITYGFGYVEHPCRTR